MPRYRYNTGALHGPWRETRAEAEADAIASRQADRDATDPSRLAWRVPGWIQMEE